MYGYESTGAEGMFGLGGFEWILLIVIAIVGVFVQSKLQSVFSKYSKVPFPNGMTGRDVAEKMLRDNGITNVKVVPTRGNLTDNFNPGNMTINLSETVYNSNSIAAAAVAAHECGHAVQHATGYQPMKLRSVLVPAVTFSSRFAIWFILAGIFLAGTTSSLFWIGIGMIAVSAIFSIVTLPVEYNASARALAWLNSQHILNGQQEKQARESLTWAARTYLVAALSAVVTLLYYIGFARRN